MDTIKKKMHVGLNVSSISKTVKFYEELFQQEADKRMQGYAKFILPELVISFIEGPKKPDTSFAHFGFQLPSSEAVSEKLEYVKNKGINTLVEEKVKCCYALQDKFWVTDPDGYRWEYYFFEADVDENDASSAECCTENATEGESCCTNEQRAEAAECC